VGNISLLRKLDWEEDDYWRIRNRLVDRGVLAIGRGRGGTLRRVIPDNGDGQPAKLPSWSSGDGTGDDPASDAGEKEIDLYDPMAEVLRTRWTNDKRFDEAIVHITALQGRRGTGGTWSRPDITVATLATYPYVPGRHFDVVTFEVKPAWAIDVTAVYEALGHLRSASLAYVLLHVPETDQPAQEEQLQEVSAEAKRHGIGMIVAGAPDNYETWEERVEPVRVTPDPRRMNDFLARQLPPGHLEKIAKWLR
jgi:hypothetical protein